MSRRVVIRPDAGPPPLWVITCAEPCQHTPPGKRGCQGLEHPAHAPEGLCWLGGYTSAERATVVAKRLGYEVQA